MPICGSLVQDSGCSHSHLLLPYPIALLDVTAANQHAAHHMSHAVLFTDLLVTLLRYIYWDIDFTLEIVEA